MGDAQGLDQTTIELLVDCSPTAPAPAGALARALYDACGVTADDLLAMTPAREGVVVRIRGGERLVRGPLRLRLPLRSGAVTVGARRLDQPPRPAGATWTIRLMPRGEATLPSPGALARALGLAAEDVGAVSTWGTGLAIEVPRARLRPDELPATVQIGDQSWDTVSETRAARPLDGPLERFLRAHGPAGEAALAEALARALDGLPIDDLPTVLAEATKKKSLTAPPTPPTMASPTDLPPA